MRFLLHQIIISELSWNAKVVDIIEDGGWYFSSGSQDF